MLYLVSFFEKEIEEWSFRIQESVIVDTHDPKQFEMDPKQERYLQMDSEFSNVVTADSGVIHPDVIPHVHSRRFAPHTTTSTTVNQRRLQDSGLGETFQQHARHFDSGRNSSHLVSHSNRTTSKPSVESGFGSQYQQIPSSHGAFSSEHHPQKGNEPTPYRWVERNVPREQPLESKQVHISTPPHSTVDTKRQKTGGNVKTEMLATDSSITSNESSFGSSGSLSRQSTGSFRNSRSFEFATNAAQRRGYSDQEVEEALQELPPDFKTSDLISTLSRRQRSRNPALHFDGTSSQPLQTNVLDNAPRSRSPFTDPGHSSPRSDPLPYQQPLSSSSSSQPLTTLVTNLSGSGKKDHSSSYSSGEKHSTSKNIDTLRRRQQELLESLRSPDAGRIEVDSPPPDDPFMTSSEPQYLESYQNTLSKSKPGFPVDGKGLLQQDKPRYDEKEVMVLSDEQDMECAVALDEAERMDIDRNQEVQYIHTQFPEGSERPDVVLLTPPKKPDPEVVVLDDDDVRTNFENALPGGIKLEHRVKTASPKSSKRVLAPTFCESNLPRIDKVWSENPKIAASLPAQNGGLRTSQSPGFGANHFRTMGYSEMDERYAMDEPDSISNISPLQGAAESEEHEMEKQIEKQLQDDFREGHLHSGGENEAEPLQLSSLNNDFEEPVFEFTGRDTGNDEHDQVHIASDGMDIDHHEQGTPVFRQIKSEDGSASRAFPRLKLHPAPDITDVEQEIDENEYRMIKQELDSSFDSDFHQVQVKKEKDAGSGGEIHIIKQEKDAEVKAPAKEDVQEFIRNFQADFQSKQQDLERKIRERTINETLNMVAEQNEAMQRQLNQKQKELEGEKEKELAAGQDMEEKLRIEREKMKEELQKELQKEMQEEMRRQIQQQVERVKQQMEQQKETQAATAAATAAAAAAAVEKDVIVIKPSQKGTACPYRPIVIDGSNVAML